MKQLKNYINETISLESNTDNDETLKQIKSWIGKSLKYCNDLTINKINGKYLVDAFEVDFKFNIKSLTNGLFEWNTVDIFICENCSNLKSLEGSPKIINDTFDCNSCNSLTNLIGSPQDCFLFDCSHCDNLISLEGAPIKCENFDCSTCPKLTSLKYLPQKGLEYINFNDCDSLFNLNGLPTGIKTVWGTGCGRDWTKKEIKKYNIDD